jgi:hypothetical protein
LETYFRHVETTIGDRAAKMTNKHRADAPAEAADRPAQRLVDEASWTDLIRDHLLGRKGHATRQRLRTDPAGTPSLRV